MLMLSTGILVDRLEILLGKLDLLIILEEVVEEQLDRAA